MFSYTEINPLELKKHQTDQNPISNLFFSNFPSPFFDEHELLPFNHVIFPDHSPPSDHITHITSSPKKEITSKEKPAGDHHPILNGHVAHPRRRNLGGAGPRKRTGKKDRHSKICTAQGVRDRRMRLSLQVARKFFDLQDMLGYDKASKTIEWLFCKSNKAIKDLTKQGNVATMSDDAKSESFVSECEEVVSEIEENSNNDNHQMEVVKVKGHKGISPKDANPKRRPMTKARESRERARARARCRTREKMMLKLGQELGQHHEERVICPYGGDASAAGDYYPTPDVDTIEKLLQGNSSTSDATNNFMGFLGNWDHVLNNDTSFQLAVTNQAAAGNSTSIYNSAATTLDFPFFHQT